MASRSSTDTADKEIAEKRTKATIDLLSLLTARSAFVDSRGKETDGPYDPGETIIRFPILCIKTDRFYLALVQYLQLGPRIHGKGLARCERVSKYGR